MRPSLLIPALALLGACADVEADVAPPTLESQSLLALQRFYEDDAGEQIAVLRELVDAEVSDTPHGFYFRELEPEDVEMFEHSDEAIWEHTAGCGVLAKMGGELSQYVTVVPEADQSFPDPGYERWTREVTGGDVDAFLHDGGELDTWNEVVKAEVGFAVEYGMDKDFRWHDDVLAQVSLVPEGHMPVDAFSTELVVGFTIELWYPLDGTLIWYNASWTEIESPIDEDNVEIEPWLDLLIDGTLDYYWGTQEHATGIPRSETDGSQTE